MSSIFSGTCFSLSSISPVGRAECSSALQCRAPQRPSSKAGQQPIERLLANVGHRKVRWRESAGIRVLAMGDEVFEACHIPLGQLLYRRLPMNLVAVEP